MRVNDRDHYNNIKDSITMNNLRKIIKQKDYLIAKVAMSSKVSDSTIKAYMGSSKIPSLPTLISLADFLDCNLDYLIDRTDNPIKVNKLDKLNSNPELNVLLNDIVSLPKDKQELVKAYIEGLLKR